MPARHQLQSAFTNLMHYRLRTVLTLLGITVGIGTVTGIAMISDGLQHMIKDEIESIQGGTMIWVSPKRFLNQGGQWAALSEYERITWNDVAAIKRESILPLQTLPSVMVNVELQVAGRSHRGLLYGTIPSYREIYEWSVSNGRFITDHDVRTWYKVCVLGDVLAAELFGDIEDSVGKEVKLNGQRFTVVGVLEPKTIFNENWGTRVIVPITTAQKQLLGRDGIEQLSIKVADMKQMDRTLADVKNALAQQYDDAAQFDVVSGKTAMDQIANTIRAIEVSVSSIAGISLLVGGIGIMNMMLVSVSERKREIGIRKSVGARRVDIVKQFIMEAVLVSTTGGMLGIVIGSAFGFVLSLILNEVWKLQFAGDPSTTSMLVSLSISLTIGLIAGIYPANKASRLDPVEAINQE